MSAPTVRYLVMAIRTPAFNDAVIAPHLAFLAELRAAGQLMMTGGFSDSTAGAYVLQNLARWTKRVASRRVIRLPRAALRP